MIDDETDTRGPSTAIAVLPGGAIALPPDEWAAAERYLAAALAPATRSAYRRAFIAFADWCKGRGLAAIPAAPETLAAYLAHEADRGVSPSAIELKAAAIGMAHQAAECENPAKAAAVRRVASGIRRLRSKKKLERAPLLAADVIRIVNAIPVWRYAGATGAATVPSMRGLRDRALLLLGFALAARRSELAALAVEHIAFNERGLLVTFPRSKTDQEGKGQTVAVPFGAKLCPVKTLKAWLEAAKIIEGPVFRSISKADRVLRRGIDGRQVARILQARARAAGFADTPVSGHSLRSGFLTSAAQNRASIWKMAEVSRHKDLRQLRTYVQATELFDDHAGEGML
jgi:site-specific recombinase XerD